MEIGIGIASLVLAAIPVGFLIYDRVLTSSRSQKELEQKPTDEEKGETSDS